MTVKDILQAFYRRLKALCESRWTGTFTLTLFINQGGIRGHTVFTSERFDLSLDNERT